MRIIQRTISLFFIMICFFHGSTLYAQACGGGTFTIKIYTLNGASNLDIHYKVFPINEDSLSIVPEYELRTKVIKEKYASKIISNTLQKDTILGNKTTGKIESGTLIFQTKELYLKKYLLKLSTNNKTFYIIAPFFGGCNSLMRILWNEKENERLQICKYIY